jgi:hypothetical protein
VAHERSELALRGESARPDQRDGAEVGRQGVTRSLPRPRARLPEGPIRPLEVGEALLLDIGRAGWVGAVEPDPWRMVFFWFVMTGFALMLAGLAAQAIERAGGRLSRTFAWAVGAFSILGAALIPASGFWLGLAPAWLAWSRSRVPAPGAP